MNTCVVHAIAANYKLHILYKFFNQQKFESRVFRDVICLKHKDGYVFIFSYGTIVCWSLSKEEQDHVMNLLKPFQTRPLNRVYSEVYGIDYADKIKIAEETIFLVNQQDPSKILDAMLAISHGLSQSEKLGIFEYKIDDLIKEIEPLYQYLGKFGKIELSRRQISQKIGQLFSVRSFINLQMSILDTPDFFWENEELEPIYQSATHYLELKPRVHALNSRMSIIQELYDVLHNELQARHSHRLEWIIIILIFIEVILSLVR